MTTTPATATATATATAIHKPAKFVDLDGCLTLDETYGCDPWDDEHYGKHPASREPDPRRVIRGTAW